MNDDDIKRLETLEQEKLLLLSKYMEVADLAERISEEAYQLTCEIERMNQLIAAERAKMGGTPA